jgi:integrase
MNRSHSPHIVQPTRVETGDEQHAFAIHPSAELFHGELVVVDDVPLWIAWDEAQEEWLKAIGRKSGAKNTVRSYKITVRDFFTWCGVPPWQVTPALVQDWVTHLVDELDRAKSTVNQKLAALSSLYNYVQRHSASCTLDDCRVTLWPADHANPFKTVERFKVSPFERAKFPSHQELQAIIDAINQGCNRGKFAFALFYCYAVTCRRDSEVRLLRWGDIQRRESGKYTFRYRCKGGKMSTAVMPAFCYQAIVVYLKAVERWPLENDEYVFVALDPERIRRIHQDHPVNPNAPISNSTANKMLKTLARRAGVDPAKAHLHALRHAGARLRWKLQKEQGTNDILEMMELLGHRDVSTTQIYTQEILEEPKDLGGELAAQALAPRPRRRKKKQPSPTQERLW